MEFKRYLKDRAVFLLTGIFALAAIILLLFAFHVSGVLIIMIAVIFLLFLCFSFIWDYLRKKDFYDRLKESLQNLDKKNLASEVIASPNFYEGQILHDALYEMGKSMTEQIGLKEQNVSDFKEYVELWVHQAKLPVASLLLKTYNNPTEENRQIRKQLIKLDSYTDQILYYTRSEVAEKDFLIKECVLSRIFNSAASKLREELQENAFEIETSGLDLTVMTDSKWMEFILIQLISNSIKYRREDGDRCLKVYADKVEEEIHFHVRDNGIGISESDLPRIFEKSFTGENGRLREKSTGMGLYIVKKLCDKLGHKIIAGSAEGEYTEFIISFYDNDYYRP